MKAAAGVASPASYVASLPADRRKEIVAVRRMVNAHLPKGYQEMFSFGMLSWGIPLSRYPDTYNKQPLMYAALAAQKNHCSLYMMGFGDSARQAGLKKAFADAGKKLKMGGGSCIHFQAADDLPLPGLGKLIAAIPSEKWIAMYEQSRLQSSGSKGKSAPKKTARPAAKTVTSAKRAKPKS